MVEVRNFIIAILLSWSVSVSAAEEYVLPAGVTVLTEDQLIDKLFGSTRSNGRFSEYCEEPSDNQKEVNLRGMHQKYGQYGGKCIVKGHLFCWVIDTPPMSAFNACYTLSLDGDTLTEYMPDGKRHYSRWPRAKLVAGNPENL